MSYPVIREMPQGLSWQKRVCSAADVRLFPFHAASTGLPELEQGTWRDLMMCSGSRSSRDQQWR